MWVSPGTAISGAIATASFINIYRDDLNALRLGELAMTSQGNKSFVIGLSATQLGVRTPTAALQVPRVNAANNDIEFYVPVSSAFQWLGGGRGTKTGGTSSDLVTVSFGAGALTQDDVIEIAYSFLGNVSVSAEAGAKPYSVTDNLVLAEPNNAVNFEASERVTGRITLMCQKSAATALLGWNEGFNGATAKDNIKVVTLTTPFTSAWDLAWRIPGTNGSIDWVVKIWLKKGQAV